MRLVSQLDNMIECLYEESHKCEEGGGGALERTKAVTTVWDCRRDLR